MLLAEDVLDGRMLLGGACLLKEGIDAEDATGTERTEAEEKDRIDDVVIHQPAVLEREALQQPLCKLAAQ